MSNRIDNIESDGPIETPKKTIVPLKNRRKVKNFTEIKPTDVKFTFSAGGIGRYSCTVHHLPTGLNANGISWQSKKQSKKDAMWHLYRALRNNNQVTAKAVEYKDSYKIYTGEEAAYTLLRAVDPNFPYGNSPTYTQEQMDRFLKDLMPF